MSLSDALILGLVAFGALATIRRSGWRLRLGWPRLGGAPRIGRPRFLPRRRFPLDRRPW